MPLIVYMYISDIKKTLLKEKRGNTFFILYNNFFLSLCCKEDFIILQMINVQKKFPCRTVVLLEDKLTDEDQRKIRIARQ